jgi:hypothetical protein
MSNIRLIEKKSDEAPSRAAPEPARAMPPKRRSNHKLATPADLSARVYRRQRAPMLERLNQLGYDAALKALVDARQAGQSWEVAHAAGIAALNTVLAAAETAAAKVRGFQRWSDYEASRAVQNTR